MQIGVEKVPPVNTACNSEAADQPVLMNIHAFIYDRAAYDVELVPVLTQQPVTLRAELCTKLRSDLMRRVPVTCYCKLPVSLYGVNWKKIIALLATGVVLFRAAVRRGGDLAPSSFLNLKHYLL